MSENDTECESFIVISLDLLLVYENKYHMQKYLDNCGYKMANKWQIILMTIFLKIISYRCCIDADFDRFNLSKGIVPTESNISKDCITCLYWFLNNGFKFPNSVWNDCYNSTILCLNISDTSVTTVKNVDHCCIIHNSKFEAISLLENSVLEDLENCLNFPSTQDL